jgi:hypothetical protein
MVGCRYEEGLEENLPLAINIIPFSDLTLLINILVRENV